MLPSARRNRPPLTEHRHLLPAIGCANPRSESETQTYGTTTISFSALRSAPCGTPPTSGESFQKLTKRRIHSEGLKPDPSNLKLAVELAGEGRCSSPTGRPLPDEVGALIDRSEPCGQTDEQALAHRRGRIQQFGEPRPIDDEGLHWGIGHNGSRSPLPIDE